MARAFLLVFVAVHFVACAADARQKILMLNAQGSPYRIGQYDCVKEGFSKLVVDGVVELVHPDDLPDSASPEIFINCPNFEFLKGSKLRTRARLYVRGEIIEGTVDIENTRGKNGADGSEVRIDANDGGDMREANGKPGGASASIILKAGTYGQGTSIHLTARGGDGGKGATGAPGLEGGNGGTGGDGGDGGNGGDAAVLILTSNGLPAGRPPDELTYDLEGGIGGKPGVGGYIRSQGMGAEGARPGGSDGSSRISGQPGRYGFPGKNGKPGVLTTWKIAYYEQKKEPLYGTP